MVKKERNTIENISRMINRRVKHAKKCPTYAICFFFGGGVNVTLDVLRSQWGYLVQIQAVQFLRRQSIHKAKSLCSDWVYIENHYTPDRLLEFCLWKVIIQTSSCNSRDSYSCSLNLKLPVE